MLDEEYIGKRKERKAWFTEPKPLDDKEIIVLEAIDALEKRGFTKIRIGDLKSVSGRVGPKEKQSALSEYEVLELVVKLMKKQCIQGYGKVALPYMRFTLRERGKELLKLLKNSEEKASSTKWPIRHEGHIWRNNALS